MKVMGRLLAAALATSMMFSMMVGCGEKKSEDSSKNASAQASAKPAEKVKIKVWTMNRHDADYMNSMIKDYNSSNKDNIEIDYQIYSDNYKQTVELAFASGEAPDVFYEPDTLLDKFYPMGYIASIDKYLTPEYKSRFGDGAFIEGINIIDGKIYSLPAVGTTPRLIYNKGIFEKAGIKEVPKSVGDMAKAAKTITDKLKGEGVYGFAANLKSPSSALSRSVDYINQRSGGTSKGYNFATGSYDFTSYKPILNAYKEIFAGGAAFPGCEALDIDPLRTQFAAGKIGMYISWTHSEPGVYQNQFPTKENWDVAPLPTVDGTVKGSQGILLAGRWFLLNAKSKFQDQGWKVMEHLYSDKLLAGYHEAGLGLVMVPSVLKLAKDPANIQKWPELKFTDNDKIWPNTPIGVNPEGQDMYMVFANFIFGKADLDKSIEDLNTRYNAAYQKAIADGKTQKLQYEGFDPANPGKVFSK